MLMNEILMANLMSAEKLQFLSYQLEDFQALIPRSLERFLETKFHQTLMDILNKQFFLLSPQKTSIREPLTSIKQFKSLACSMKNSRQHALFTFNEIAMISQYSKLLEYIVELKSYFNDRIFEFVLNITSGWKELKMADCNRKFIDDVTKLNGCSFGEDEIKILTDSVDQIKAIELRWTKMIDCEELFVDFFENETIDEMSSANETASYKLICYVLSDQVRKLKKCVGVCTRWLQAASSKRDSCNRSPPIDSRRRIMETWMRILEVDERIIAEERNADRLKTELKRLADKEMRYAILENDYEETAEKLEEVCSGYRSALLERLSLNRKIPEEPTVSGEEGVAVGRLLKVGGKINTAHKDMKMLNYSFALLQEDMALEASMRPSYIRFEESVKEKLLEAETQLEVNKRKKRELDKELILLKANSKWFESIHGDDENDEFLDDENTKRRGMRESKIQSSEQIDSNSIDSNRELEWEYRNQKPVENDCLSQNSVPSNNLDSPKPYHSTHARLILELPVTQNLNDKKEWKYDKHKTRIPKLIVR